MELEGNNQTLTPQTTSPYIIKSPENYEQENKDFLNEDIFNMIQNENWRDLLRYLTKDMDPWDVDLEELNKRFQSFLSEMETSDLRIPAKIVLCSAIIYRLKSEAIIKTDEEIDEEHLNNLIDEAEEKDNTIYIDKDIKIPLIKMPLIRKPVRKVSIDELINALDKALKIKSKREVRHHFRMELNQYDITKIVEEVYSKIQKYLQQRGTAKFSMLLKQDMDKIDKLRHFNSILLLQNQQRIHCTQKQLFGDIDISITPNQQN